MDYYTEKAFAEQITIKRVAICLLNFIIGLKKRARITQELRVLNKLFSTYKACIIILFWSNLVLLGE